MIYAFLKLLITSIERDVVEPLDFCRTLVHNAFELVLFVEEGQWMRSGILLADHQQASRVSPEIDTESV